MGAGTNYGQYPSQFGGSPYQPANPWEFNQPDRQWQMPESMSQHEQNIDNMRQQQLDNWIAQGNDPEAFQMSDRLQERFDNYYNQAQRLQQDWQNQNPVQQTNNSLYNGMQGNWGGQFDPQWQNSGTFGGQPQQDFMQPGNMSGYSQNNYRMNFDQPENSNFGGFGSQGNGGYTPPNNFGGFGGNGKGGSG